jgi:DNA-binding transcriptional ArsR family regulator
MMADEFADWAVLALSALAHESRLQVHRLLVQAGGDGLSAGAIAEELGLPASSLSFHLAHMQAAEMVNQRREGRSLIYSVNFECMDALIAYLQENCCKGIPTAPPKVHIKRRPRPRPLATGRSRR